MFNRQHSRQESGGLRLSPRPSGGGGKKALPHQASGDGRRRKPVASNGSPYIYDRCVFWSETTNVAVLIHFRPPFSVSCGLVFKLCLR